MPSIAPEFAKRLKAEYPNLSVKWNDGKNLFEIVETYRVGVLDAQRVIWEYENVDGTRLPFVGDHCKEMLHSMDTRKWPLKERVRIMREERHKAEEARRKQLLNSVHDHVSDNEIYFSSAERFFMNPNFVDWKTKHMPSQARVLKSWGEL